MARSKGPIKSNHDEHDEYHFAGDDGPHFDIEPPSKPPQAAWKKVLLNKRFLTICGLIVAVFIVYGYISLTRPGQKEEIAVTEPVTESKPVTVNVSPVQPAVSDETVMLNQVQGQMTTLAAQAQQNQQQIQQLQANLQQLQGSVTAMSQQVTNLADSIAVLAKQPELTPPPAARVSVSKPVHRPKLPVYYIRAVVPGRAWVESTAGNMFTVKVGDKIPGYGVVQVINSRRGAVGMSSGVVIRFKDS